MRRPTWFFAIAAAAFLWPAVAGADIDKPPEIPANLSGRDDLVSQRSVLMEKAEALEQKISAHNAQCSEIPEDSPMVDKCQSNQAKLLSEIEAYKKSLQSYEETLAKAANSQGQ